jgi:hypothetical protein
VHLVNGPEINSNKRETNDTDYCLLCTSKMNFHTYILTLVPTTLLSAQTINGMFKNDCDQEWYVFQSYYEHVRFGLRLH